MRKEATSKDNTIKKLEKLSKESKTRDDYLVELKGELRESQEETWKKEMEIEELRDDIKRRCTKIIPRIVTEEIEKAKEKFNYSRNKNALRYIDVDEVNRRQLDVDEGDGRPVDEVNSGQLGVDEGDGRPVNVTVGVLNNPECVLRILECIQKRG